MQRSHGPAIRAMVTVTGIEKHAHGAVAPDII
jgi:hypothetical protein